MNTASWDDVLDALEERLRLQERAVAGRASTPTSVDLPVPEGKLPARLESRARALLDRTTSLQDQVADSLAAMRGRQQSAAPAYGSRTRHTLADL